MVIFNQWLLFKISSSCITQDRKSTYICWMEEVMNQSIYKPLLKIFSCSCLLKGTSIVWSRKPFTTWPFYISKNISCYLSNIPLALIFFTKYIYVYHCFCLLSCVAVYNGLSQIQSPEEYQYEMTVTYVKNYFFLM